MTALARLTRIQKTALNSVAVLTGPLRLGDYLDTLAKGVIDITGTPQSFLQPITAVFRDKGGAYHNVKASGYNAVGDGVANDRTAINTAATAAVNGSIFFPPGTYLIGSNLTIASTVTVAFAAGAKLSIPDGVTVTINGHIIAPLMTQIFALTGTGKATLASKTPILYPEWWGAAGDSTTDDTLPWQACIDAGVASRLPISMPPRTYKISATLIISQSTGFVLRGQGAALAGARYSQFVWAGNTTDPLLSLQDVSRGDFTDFSIRGSSAFPLHTGVRGENIRAGGTISPLRNLWRNVIIDGATPGIGLGRGWVLYADVSGGSSSIDLDNNDDYWTFDSCHVTNYTYAGWLFNHSQSKAHVLTNCAAQSNYTLSKVGVGCGIDWDAGGAPGGAVITGLTSGSFTWFGGGISHAVDAAFYLGSTGDSVWLGGGFNIENAARLLYAGANLGSSPTPSVTINGGRYAPSLTLIGDGYFIDYNLGGQIEISSLRVEVGDTTSVPKIRHTPGPGLAGHATLTIRSSYIETNDPTTFIVQGNSTSRVIAKGNRYRNRLLAVYGDLPDQDYSRKGGIATIASGQTSIVVTHGIDVTPAPENIQATPTATATNDPGNWWIDTITSTQFTLHVRNDPGAGGLPFGWKYAA